MNASARRMAWPPEWAGAWGEDEYGPFAELHFGKVVQRMRWIAPGTFLMGSPEDEAERGGDEIQHEVQLSEGYWLADTTCTQELWMAVMGENPSSFQERAEGETSRPVEQVSWEDCQRFLGTLNVEVSGLDLRLPTEAEWEYACRAGKTTPFSFGKNITPEQVNYDGNHPYAGGKKGEFRQQTVPVKSVPANPWGLFEMHGNVYELCLDEYAPYGPGPAVDPVGVAEGENVRDRVFRGGTWNGHAGWARSAERSWLEPSLFSRYVGFRVARGRPVLQVEQADGARGPVEA
jgi:formylglycine-generating enzyme required for sulfatase activity